MIINKVKVSKQALKQLIKLPNHITLKFISWVKSVEDTGLEATNLKPGYRAEALKGKRIGQNSIRLNRSYRVIFKVDLTEGEVLLVIEVNKHDY